MESPTSPQRSLKASDRSICDCETCCQWFRIALTQKQAIKDADTDQDYEDRIMAWADHDASEYNYRPFPVPQKGENEMNDIMSAFRANTTLRKTRRAGELDQRFRFALPAEQMARRTRRAGEIGQRFRFGLPAEHMSSIEYQGLAKFGIQWSNTEPGLQEMQIHDEEMLSNKYTPQWKPQYNCPGYNRFGIRCDY